MRSTRGRLPSARWGRHGDPDDALPDFAGLLLRWRRSGNWTPQWTTLRNLAELLARLEVDQPAVVIASAAEVEQTASPSFGHESDRLGRPSPPPAPASASSATTPRAAAGSR